MTRRIELEPIAKTAIGGPWASRPCAALVARARLRVLDEAADEAPRRGFFERFATTRQARVGHEIIVGIERLFAQPGLYARRTAIRQEIPALLVVLEIGNHDLPEHLLVHGGVENGAQHLYPAVEIARHHVGRGNINRCLRVRQRTAVAETIYAAVLKETTDDRFHSDVFGQPRHARPQAADTAHYQVNRDASLRCIVKRVDDAGIDEGVHFHPDCRRPSDFGVSYLLRNVVKDTLTQIDRRDRHLLQLGRLGLSAD